MKIRGLISIILLTVLSCTTVPQAYEVVSTVPDIKMPENGLKFTEIEDYKNYKMISSHFRTDKDEFRYILTNDIAYKAFHSKTEFPNGSKIVKIGFASEKMLTFGTALEAGEVQRIEYMIKDSKNFSENPGNWGYARFVKEENQYKPWQEGTKSCIACHNLAGETDFVFTQFHALE